MISAQPMKFAQGWPPVHPIDAAKDHAKIALAIFPCLASLHTSKNLNCNRLNLLTKFFTLDQNATVSQSGTNIDQRLKNNFLSSRIPVRPPEIILLTAIIQQN